MFFFDGWRLRYCQLQGSILPWYWLIYQAFLQKVRCKNVISTLPKGAMNKEEWTRVSVCRR
ncbi:hypothetical protein OH492_09630 [Vibrio chagasii]|nr:hypothetical protein [Vibrio chagasii]